MTKTLIKQNRDIEIGNYRFNEEEHLHQFLKDGEWKNLTGISSVVKDITNFSIAAYYGSRRAVMELGLDPKIDKKKYGEADRIEKEAQTCLEKLKILPSIDLKKLLLNAYKAHSVYAKKRAEKGTTSHDIIDQWIKKCISENQGFPMPSEEPIVKKFIELTKHREPRFIASEKHGYNTDYWIGGITDVIVETNIGLGIWDNKDRPAIYGKDLIQMGGYTFLFQDMTFTHVLGIPLEGNEVREFLDVPQLKQVFINQLGVHRFMESVEPKE